MLTLTLTVSRSALIVVGVILISSLLALFIARPAAARRKLRYWTTQSVLAASTSATLMLVALAMIMLGVIGIGTIFELRSKDNAAIEWDDPLPQPIALYTGRRALVIRDIEMGTLKFTWLGRLKLHQRRPPDTDHLALALKWDPIPDAVALRTSLLGWSDKELHSGLPTGHFQVLDSAIQTYPGDLGRAVVIMPIRAKQLDEAVGVLELKVDHSTGSPIARALFKMQSGADDRTQQRLWISPAHR
jgi:hypothetical protein